MVVDLHGRMATEQGDRALVRGKTLFHVQRFPRAVFLVLADAERVLRGMAQRGLGDLVRLGAADVDDDEAQGAADGRVRPEAVAQRVVAAVHAQRPADRAVENRHRRRGKRRYVDAVNAELLLAHGLDAGQHDRKVRSVAPRHDRVDGDLLDRGATVVRPDLPDQFVRVAARRGQHPPDAVLGRRDDRQPVRHPALVQQLDRIVRALDARGMQGGGIRHQGLLTVVRRRGYLIACGLIGEPTAPVIGSGGATNRNSYTPSFAQSSAKPSRSKISPTSTPACTIRIMCRG